MQENSTIAFKEWAVVCQALATGRQAVILRKGGIHEGREGFRVSYREFWLFPTSFHQRAEHLSPEAAPLVEQALALRPPPGRLWLQHYAVIDQVLEISDESRLARLAGQHIWSEETLRERFHYRAPGLFALVARIHALPAPRELADEPRYAGCRSWVDLQSGLSTEGAVPVVNDAEFAERAGALRDAILND